jgi:DNA mismatch repair protein MutL
MNKVQVLPSEIISKIAAGEVIERPSSVVKELIENSLDAQATSIDIMIRHAGRTLIKISDNGSGIDKDDLETIFLRHATSKIHDLNDLYAIRSLGFRGEALFSIAAISDLQMRSRTADQSTGWEIHLRGGQKRSLKPLGMQPGTDITIQELFFNTPARRKFLKRDTTEFNHIVSILLPYVIIHNHCRFHLSSDYRTGTRTVIEVEATDDKLTRLVKTLHLERKDIIELKQDFPGRDVKVHAFLGDSNIRRSSKDLQFIFVNNRPVTHRLLNFRLNDLYRKLFPKDVYPFFMINLTIPPNQLDVNIHPSKREVKIEKEYDLCVKICALCESQLLRNTKPLQFSSSDAPPPFAYPRTSESGEKETRTKNDQSLPSFSFEKSDRSGSRRISENYSSEYIAQATQNLIEPVMRQLGSAPQETDVLLRTKLDEATFIGAFHNKYLLFETADSMLVIDQHAAQERINYEKLLFQVNNGSLEKQRLLSPVIVPLSPAEMLEWEDIETELASLGFETTQFDEGSIAVHSHPALIKDTEIAVRNIICGKKSDRHDKDTIARAACRRSVMAGDIVSQAGAERLRELLITTDDPFTCPHGRPTIVELNEGFLNKQFLRT